MEEEEEEEEAEEEEEEGEEEQQQQEEQQHGKRADAGSSAEEEADGWRRATDAEMEWGCMSAWPKGGWLINWSFAEGRCVHAVHSVDHCTMAMVRSFPIAGTMFVVSCLLSCCV